MRSKIAAIVALALSAGGCAYLPPLVTDEPAAIGSGHYRYQLVLADAEGNPQPDTDFALNLRGERRLPFIADEKNVWRGRTDAKGRTPVFALPFRAREKDLLLLRRIGDGPLGEKFRFGQDDRHPAAGFPYRLVMCTDPPREFIGRTDANGYTAYAASALSVSVGVFAMEDPLSGQAPDRDKANVAYCQKRSQEDAGR